MENEHSFVVFLEQHPELLGIASSEKHVRVLAFIAARAGSAETISREVKWASQPEAEKALSDLEEAGLSRQTRAGGKVLFYASQKGMDFLKRYEGARKGFSAR